MRLPTRFTALLLACLYPAGSLFPADEAVTLDLALPTANDALLRGDGPDFYQYIKRDFRGVQSTPWEGGQYGFVRDPIENPAGVVYRRFHEGIDIKPLQRDAKGEPADPVNAIADGTVVYTNTVPGQSNYGRYVVVQHVLGGCFYYSLYAHLASIAATAGTAVKKGGQLGVMGHTGAGIDRERAHVHLEFNLMLSQRYEEWHGKSFKGEPNRHGNFNGLNLVGLDIARLFLDLKKNPSLTIPEFLGREEVFYKVRITGSSNFDLVQRYPWLAGEAATQKPASWELSFNRGGVPLKAVPTDVAVKEAVLTWVKPSPVPYQYLTRGVVRGSGSTWSLSESGKRDMRLLTAPD